MIALCMQSGNDLHAIGNGGLSSVKAPAQPHPRTAQHHWPHAWVSDGHQPGYPPATHLGIPMAVDTSHDLRNEATISVPRLERSTTRPASTQTSALNLFYFGSPAHPGRRSCPGTGELSIGSGSVHVTPDPFHRELGCCPPGAESRPGVEAGE
jgi:hypothetical protein